MKELDFEFQVGFFNALPEILVVRKVSLHPLLAPRGVQLLHLLNQPVDVELRLVVEFRAAAASELFAPFAFCRGGRVGRGHVRGRWTNDYLQFPNRSVAQLRPVADDAAERAAAVVNALHRSISSAARFTTC